MTERDAKAPFKVTPYRRVVQLLVLALLVFIPLSSQNPVEWAPSRIVLGQMPEPATFNLSGDTWVLQIGALKLSHPLAFLDAWVSAKVIYLPLLFAALIPLALTLLLGRFFCSWLCPVGFILELNMKTRRLAQKLGLGWNAALTDWRWAILLLCLLLSLLLAMPLLSLIDPPHTLGRELMNLCTHHQLTISGLTLLLGLFFCDTFIRSRFCCSMLCPSGGGLEILGKYRLLRLKANKERCIACAQCDAVCPFELAPMNLALQHPFNWSKCDNCGLCRDACPTGAIAYRLGKK